MNTVFFGASSFVIPLIEKIRERFELSHVFTTEQLATNAVPSYCNTHGIPFTSVETLSSSDTLYKLHAASARFAVLADFGVILPPHLFHAFRKGILNIHPSLLPKYRGPTPAQTAILYGDTKTGVTIIKLDNEIDHGPVLAQKEEPIRSNDTAQSLYERLFEKGSQLLFDSIDAYLNGTLIPQPQDHSLATYTKQLSKSDGYIDTNNPCLPGGRPLTKENLERMIRAYYPWPGVWTRLTLNYGGQNKEKIVKFLPEQKLQVEGKKPMSYKDFLNGYPMLKDQINLFL